MRTYSTMLRCRPDFFIHSGDHIYADCPFPAERRLPNGEVWKNIVTEEKAAVAQTLSDFRGNYKYNLLDRNLRAFNAEVPMFAQWDDHEVTNDWCPNVALGWEGYADKSVSTTWVLTVGAKLIMCASWPGSPPPRTHPPNAPASPPLTPSPPPTAVSHHPLHGTISG
jgi:PhoD-like phosphatase